MPNLVEITDPHTGERFMVHPWIAEHGEWFPPFDGTPETRKAFQAMLPGRKYLIEALAQQHKQPLTFASSEVLQQPITKSSPMRERTGNGA